MQKLKDRLIALFSVIGITILGLIGGQSQKGARRFGVPGLAIIASIATNKIEWRDFVWILLIPVLVMGYGESSWLFTALKADWLVRLVYAALLSLPFLFYGLFRWMIAVALLIGAFQVHAGKICSIGTFDFLVEDILRYGVLGVLVAYQFLVPKKS